MTASRATHFVHADGTVSTRNSKTRMYTWAVEVTVDQHAEAVDKAAWAKELEAGLESFDRAVATNQVIRKSKSWPRGGTYRDFYMEDPTTGERHWIGAESEEGDGTVRTPFNGKEEVTSKRADKVRQIETARANAQELAAGPRYTYEIVRWSERRDSAEKSLNSFYATNRTYRVVEAVEGKAPAAQAPVQEGAQEEPADSTEAATPAAQEPKLTEAQEKALVWARNLEARGQVLFNNIGASIVTARKLAALGLATMDEGWETDWAPGFKKSKKPKYVWSIKLTEAGQAVAARLAGEPAQEAPEAAQEPQEDTEPEERHTVTLEHVLAAPGEMVTRAWVHAVSQADPVDAMEWSGVLNVFDTDVAERLKAIGWERAGELEYLAGPNAYRGPVRRC